MTLIKSFFVGVCAAAIPVIVAAADPRSFILRTQVMKLPPGTVVEAQVSVEYALHELHRNGAEITFTETFRTPAEGQARIRIVAGKDGTAQPTEFRFKLPEMPPPPEGTVEKILFPLTYKIVCPAKVAEGTCHSFERTSKFSMTPRPSEKGKPILRCFKAQGLGAPQGVSIGVGVCGVDNGQEAVPRG